MSVSYRRHDPHNTSAPHAHAAVTHVELEILRGAARERVRTVTGPAFLIGTAADCDLILGDPKFPAVHSCLLRGESGVTIRHLGFDPELVINDESVECATLNDGDRLGLGRYEFRVHIGGEHPHNSGRPSAEREEHALRTAPLASHLRRRSQPDEKARAQVRELLAEIQRLEAPQNLGLRIYGGRQFPAAPLAKLIRRA